jgi:hypothetical protein
VKLTIVWLEVAWQNKENLPDKGARVINHLNQLLGKGK